MLLMIMIMLTMMMCMADAADLAAAGLLLMRMMHPASARRLTIAMLP
jgi:hypothetical protein